MTFCLSAAQIYTWLLKSERKIKGKPNLGFSELAKDFVERENFQSKLTYCWEKWHFFSCGFYEIVRCCIITCWRHHHRELYLYYFLLFFRAELSNGDRVRRRHCSFGSARYVHVQYGVCLFHSVQDEITFRCGPKQGELLFVLIVFSIQM